jgi:hypothetical protein
VIIMAIDKFYIIENNIVKNIALYHEEDAYKLKLKRAPIYTEFGMVDTGWTYLPAEDTYLPPPRDILAEWKRARSMRDALLFESDLYVLPDRWATYTQDEQHAWSVYRKTLRDIPQTYIDPNEIVWPDKPLVEAVVNYKPSEPIDPA